MFFGVSNWNPSTPTFPPGTQKAFATPAGYPPGFQTVGSPVYPTGAIQPIAAGQSETQAFAMLRILAIFVSPVLGGFAVYYAASKRNRVSKDVSA